MARSTCRQPNRQTEGKTSLAWVTGRMAPGQGVPDVLRAARELSTLAGDVGPAVRITQASLDKHLTATPDTRSQAVATAVAHAGAARAQLRDTLVLGSGVECSRGRLLSLVCP
jgi:hypothetical protein